MAGPRITRASTGSSVASLNINEYSDGSDSSPRTKDEVPGFFSQLFQCFLLLLNVYVLGNLLRQFFVALDLEKDFELVKETISDLLNHITALWGELIDFSKEVLHEIISGDFDWKALLTTDNLLLSASLWSFANDFVHRSAGYRLVLVGFALVSIHFGTTILPAYLVLRVVLLKPLKEGKKKKLFANQSNYMRAREYLQDIPPKADTKVTRLAASLPDPFGGILIFLSRGLGYLEYFATSFLYFTYVVFVALPISSTLFSLRRALLGKSSSGAKFAPLETVDNKRFAFKGVIVVSGYLRLWCFQMKENFLFNIVAGFWLRRILEVFCLFEVVLPFKDDFTVYFSFLMEEFGSVFPLGDGLGFAKYSDVKDIIENPKQRKDADQFLWCSSANASSTNKYALLHLPQQKLDQKLVREGRQYARDFLKHTNDVINSYIGERRLDAILPYANVDGSMVDEDLIEISFGSALFHLLTGGELTREEPKSYYSLIKNPYPMYLDWTKSGWFGGHDEHSGRKDYETLRDAFLRYAESTTFQGTLAKVDPFKHCLLVSIVKKLFNEEGELAKYEQNSKRYILEMACKEKSVPIVNFTAQNFGDSHHIKIAGCEVHVPDGTHIRCCIQNANQDGLFGLHANTLNVDSDYGPLGLMLSFNGAQHQIEAGDGDVPPRACPAYAEALILIEYLVDRYCLSDPRPTITEERMKEISDDESWFTYLILIAAQKKFGQDNRFFPTASDAKHPRDVKPKDLGSYPVLANGERSIPVEDEDIPSFKRLGDNVLMTLCNTFSLEDADGEWEKSDEAVAWRDKWFGANYPAPNVDYTELCPTVASLVSTMAFAGLCSFYTQKVDAFESDSAVQKFKPSRAVFANDNTLLSAYDVRDGFQRYGSIAYFDKDFEVIGIYTCCDGAYIARPSGFDLPITGDKPFAQKYAPWVHAMWVWRVSAFALTTVVDHLVNVHLIAANTLVSASRRYLPHEHPVRAFIKMFTFGTIGVNLKAFKTLCSQKGFVARCWAFKEDEVQKMLRESPIKFKKNFIDYIPPSMRDVDGYPGNQDLPKYWEITRKFVEDMMDSFYGDTSQTSVEPGQVSQRQRNINNDKKLQDFLVEIAASLSLKKEVYLTKFDDIVDVIASLFCSVTVLHEHFGQVSDYVGHPKVAGTTLRPDQEIDSIQTYQLLCTLVAGTGLRMPRLMGNWEHLFVRNRFSNQAVRVLREYQDSLDKLADEIETANQTRKFPLQSFNPANLESSVSV